MIGRSFPSRVLVTVAMPACAAHDDVLFEEALPILAGELATLIGVQQQAYLRFTPPHCREQRLQHQLGMPRGGDSLSGRQSLVSYWYIDAVSNKRDRRPLAVLNAATSAYCHQPENGEYQVITSLCQFGREIYDQKANQFARVVRLGM